MEEGHLSDLLKYNILDTPSEAELDDLAQLSATICGTPVAIISFFDKKRQWFKAKIGINISQVPIKESFCQLTLNYPDDLLVVEDTLADERFCKNPNVTRKNGIRFYAGVPLVSDNGNVIGTLCVVDYVKKRFHVKQRLALKLLAKKVMVILEIRRKLNLHEKEIELDASNLKELTNLAPGAIFKLLADESGNMEFIFLSDGIKKLMKKNHLKHIKTDPKRFLDLLYPEDKAFFIKSFKESYQKNVSLDLEYRIMKSNKSVKWHWLKANPEKKNDGVVVWYGTIQDISLKLKCLEVLDKMLFDLSHVIRKPTANILGCVDVLKNGNIRELETEQMILLIQNQAHNLEFSIRNLNSDYSKLKSALKRKWN